MWHWTDRPDLLAVLRGAGAGAIAGFVSGLLGVSPGGILVPAVCMTLGVDQHVAQGVSLVAQIPPTGLGGVSEYRRRGQAIPLKWVVLLALGFIVGGAFGAGVAGHLSDQVLRWSFVGYLLLLAALVVLSVLRRRNDSAEASAERVAKPHGLALLAVGIVAGLSSGALGIGGGLAVTALSTTMLHLGQHRAQAMSLILTLLPLTIPAAYVYLARDGCSHGFRSPGSSSGSGLPPPSGRASPSVCRNACCSRHSSCSSSQWRRTWRPSLCRDR